MPAAFFLKKHDARMGFMKRSVRERLEHESGDFILLLQGAGAATARSTVIPTMGERGERRRWRNKRPERVAAVGKKQACCGRRSFCRAPQQGERSDSNLQPDLAGCHITMVGEKMASAEAEAISVREINYFFRDSSTATATETVIPTMGLLPAPRKPIISTWAGTEEEPAN